MPWHPGFPIWHRGSPKAPGRIWGLAGCWKGSKRYALAAWLPHLAPGLSQSAGKHLRPGQVLSVSFGKVEKRYAQRFPVTPIRGESAAATVSDGTEPSSRKSGHQFLSRYGTVEVSGRRQTSKYLKMVSNMLHESCLRLIYPLVGFLKSSTSFTLPYTVEAHVVAYQLATCNACYFFVEDTDRILTR